MKLPRPTLVLSASLALILSGCDRGATKAEAQRLAEERAALEREKAALAAQQAAAREAATQEERRRLEADRADLNRERDKFVADRAVQEAADRQAKATAERDARMVEERRAQEEEARKREAEAREQEAQQNTEAQTVDFFYDALDPYGEWIEIDRYGYAFRPNTNQIAMWRPYTDGGWVYTEYGWTWRSNEPFGWATYHYGRWAKLPRLGWVWIPGTEWGPAWVSWRRSSDYIGWAPLPPEAWSAKGFNTGVDSYYDIGPGLYSFLRIVDFGEPTYAGRVIEPERNVAIIDNSVNITKVVYKTVNNKTTVVNEGPDLTVINKAARRPVQQLKVQRVNAGGQAAAKVQGGTLQVVAPDLKKPAAPTKPKQVKETVKATEMDRGWKEAKADSQKMRQEAAKQAREAEQAERGEAKVPPVVKPGPAAAVPGNAPNVPGKPERPGRPQPPEGAAKPDAPNRASTIPWNRPEKWEGAPVPPPKTGKPNRPGVPGAEPRTNPAVPPAPNAPATPEPAAENPVPTSPGAPAGSATPGAGQRPDRQRPPLRQFRQQNASPTPVTPESASPSNRNVPGRRLRNEPVPEN